MEQGTEIKIPLSHDNQAYVRLSMPMTKEERDRFIEYLKLIPVCEEDTNEN